MRRYRTLEAMAADFSRPPHLAIGTFDGLHRGHQAVLRAMLRRARGDGVPAAVLTFVPHPMTVLRPEGAPPALTTGAQRARLLAAMGVDALVELTFDAQLAALAPAAFVQDYLCRRARVRHAFVGADFTFGAGAAGTAETLAVLGRQACGLETTTVPLVRAAGAPVSSTRIRQALQAGRPALASRLLGRPYALEGPVVRGDGRGAGLGFPTANVALPAGVATPAPGVYAVRCRVLEGGAADPAGELPGVANLGVRPTVGGQQLRLEVHLLDFAGDLRERTLEVAFVRRLRGERRFPDLAALAAQIARDAGRARAILAAARPDADAVGAPG